MVVATYEKDQSESYLINLDGIEPAYFITTVELVVSYVHGSARIRSLQKRSVYYVVIVVTENFQRI